MTRKPQRPSSLPVTQSLRSAALEDCVLCQETLSSSELAAKTCDGDFEGVWEAGAGACLVPSLRRADGPTVLALLSGLCWVSQPGGHTPKGMGTGRHWIKDASTRCHHHPCAKRCLTRQPQGCENNDGTMEFWEPQGVEWAAASDPVT